MVQRMSASINNTVGTSESEDLSAFEDVPLSALGKNTLKQLSVLNNKKIIRSDENYERDFRGIAALAEITCSTEGEDPIGKVLKRWINEHPATANFKNLLIFLRKIDRSDVADDINDDLVNDARIYEARKSEQPPPVVIESRRVNVESRPVNVESRPVNVEPRPVGIDSRTTFENELLTIDDAACVRNGLPLQRYDAFVLFAEGDEELAAEIKKNLQDVLNFKLCTINDLLAGIMFTHRALTKLIEERCYRLLVVYTKNFSGSHLFTYLMDYTQSVQIEHNTRKIIPIIYDKTLIIPRTLKIYTHLKYYENYSPLTNFWSRLEESIRNYSVQLERLPTPPTTLLCYEQGPSKGISPTPLNSLPRNKKKKYQLFRFKKTKAQEMEET